MELSKLVAVVVVGIILLCVLLAFLPVAAGSAVTGNIAALLVAIAVLYGTARAFSCVWNS